MGCQRDRHRTGRHPDQSSRVSLRSSSLPENFDETSGLPFDIYTDPTDYTKTQGQGSDQPLTVLNMAWTNLGTGNVSTNDVRNIIDGIRAR